MIVTDLEAAAHDAPHPNPTRPATALLHDADDLRLVLFHLAPGQAVPTHTSPSTVALQIVSGSGFVTGGTGEVAVEAGRLVTYAPHEPHGMRAAEAELVLLAAIAPRPGTR
jgi:quercetin dioxygenase-like cupin family protein